MNATYWTTASKKAIIVPTTSTKLIEVIVKTVNKELKSAASLRNDKIDATIF